MPNIVSSAIMLQNFQRLPLQKKVLFRQPREKRPFHLHCTLIGGGHEALYQEDEYCFDGLKRGNHYFCNLQLCLTGRGEMSQGDFLAESQGKSGGKSGTKSGTKSWTEQPRETRAEQLYSLEPGMLFLTQVPQNHRYYLPKATIGEQEKTTKPAWEFVYLTLAGAEVQRIGEKVLELNRSPILYLSNEQLRELWNILQALLIEGQTDMLFYSARVYQLLLGILAEKISEAKQLESPAEIRRMQEYIYSNYQHNISTCDISKQSGLSENYAMRLFKKHTGKTIHQYLLQIRLIQAQNLLRYSLRSIKEISTMVGFCDDNYFIRVFRQHFGIAPGKYRRQD